MSLKSTGWVAEAKNLSRDELEETLSTIGLGFIKKGRMELMRKQVLDSIAPLGVPLLPERDNGRAGRPHRRNAASRAARPDSGTTPYGEGRLAERNCKGIEGKGRQDAMNIDTRAFNAEEAQATQIGKEDQWQKQRPTRTT